MVEVYETNKSVLIASCSFDEAQVRPVADLVEQAGYEVVVYEADKVASDAKSLTIQLNNDTLSVHYDNKLLDLGTIAAAWFRRPNTFGPPEPDRARQRSLDKERQALQDILWATVSERAWLNSPERLRLAGNKLAQLVLARAMGFVTPDIIVSNQWDEIMELPSGQIIVKMPFGILDERDRTRVLYTTVLDNPNDLPMDGIPFPGIWQTYISKSREWRITAVGDETFDVAIYTGTDAKDDWRRRQDGPEVVFRKEKFPDAMRRQCLEFLAHFDLRYGAFDFIEDIDGRIVFVELNPNGQFGWLEDKLGLPISQAIAAQLIAIADKA